MCCLGGPMPRLKGVKGPRRLIGRVGGVTPQQAGGNKSRMVRRLSLSLKGARKDSVYFLSCKKIITAWASARIFDKGGG